MKRLIALALLAATLVAPCFAQTQGRLPGVLFPSDRGTRTYANLQAQVTAVASTPYTFVLDRGTWTITSDLSIPATIALKLLPGAVLNISAGKNLEILGSFDAPAEAVFTGSGTASGPAVFPYRIPEWGDATQYDLGDGYLVLEGANVTTSTNAWTWIAPASDTVQASLDYLDTAILPGSRVSIETNGLAYTTNAGATAQIAVSNIDAAVSSLNSVVTNQAALIATNAAIVAALPSLTPYLPQLSISNYFEFNSSRNFTNGTMLASVQIDCIPGTDSVTDAGGNFNTNTATYTIPVTGKYAMNAWSYSLGCAVSVGFKRGAPATEYWRSSGVVLYPMPGTITDYTYAGGWSVNRDFSAGEQITFYYWLQDDVGNMSASKRLDAWEFSMRLLYAY